MKRELLALTLAVLLTMMCLSCGAEDEDLYKTFIMDEGVVDFTLEYPEKYKIDWLQSAESSGNNRERSLSFSLNGPLNSKTNTYTRIIIGSIPSDLYTSKDAKEAIEKAEAQAETWKGYELLNKYESVVDGIQAYRLEYKMINIVPIIAGESDETHYEVTRMVRFITNSYLWTIQIQSDSSTAESDKADFDHIIDTFHIFD